MWLIEKMEELKFLEVLNYEVFLVSYLVLCGLLSIGFG